MSCMLRAPARAVASPRCSARSSRTLVAHARRAAPRRAGRLVCRANLFQKLLDIIPRDEEGKDDGKGGRELTKGSLIELIGFGLGAPVPSEVRIDKENMKVYMDFEANNFEVEGKYRDEGWVDEEPAGPGFFERLFGKKAPSEEDEA